MRNRLQQNIGVPQAMQRADAGCSFVPWHVCSRSVASFDSLRVQCNTYGALHSTYPRLPSHQHSNSGKWDWMMQATASGVGGSGRSACCIQHVSYVLRTTFPPTHCSRTVRMSGNEERSVTFWNVAGVNGMRPWRQNDCVQSPRFVPFHHATSSHMTV